MAEFTLSSHAKDLTGVRFGSLVAIKPLGKKGRNVLWEFLCDCGSSYTSEGCWVTAQKRKATNPLAPSCGCLNRRTTKELRLTHGFSKHPLFWVWVAMRERCYNPNHPDYSKYGAKGVTICNSWKDDAGAFINWALTNGWQKGLHLDKDILSYAQGIVPTYSPTTCQFITPAENSRATWGWLEKNT
jgi:hypothetical protein